MSFFNFSKDAIGIDPGSQYLRIIRNGEIVFNEPSQISLSKSAHNVTGLGNSIRSTNDDVTLQPVDFTIADFIGFEALLSGAIKKSIRSNSILPKTYVMYYCIPINTTEVEKRTYRDSAQHAGASEVYMIVQSCCAAAGLDILFEKKHFILVDFGYSKVEITVFLNSIPISVGLVRMGTARIYSLLKNHIKRKYNIHPAEKEIDSILTELKQSHAEITIQDTTIPGTEINDLLDYFFVLVNDTFLETMERVKVHSDLEKVKAGGVYFTGGGSAIDFLREKMIADSQLKNTVSQQPLMDNINGLRKIITDKEKFKDYLLV